MRTILSVIWAWGNGFALCCVLFFLLSFASFNSHQRYDKIRNHLLDGLHDLTIDSHDAFTDCLAASGAIAPTQTPLEYMLSPKVFLGTNFESPCSQLVNYMSGNTQNEFRAYARYALGSVHLVNIFLSTFDLSTVRQIYKWTLVASFVLFAVVGFRINRSIGTSFALASCGMFAGVGVNAFGGHLGHSATFFIPLIAIVLFVAKSPRISGIGNASLLGSVIGALTCYFDILSGGLPFTLALSIFVLGVIRVNGSKNGVACNNYMILGDVITMTLAYVVSVIALLAIKIFTEIVLLRNINAFAEFRGQLLWRLSSDGIGETGVDAIWTVYQKLLMSSSDVYFFGSAGATTILFAGFLSWCIAGWYAKHCYRTGKNNKSTSLNFFIPLFAAMVVPVWFAVFRNHGFIHAWFMCRVLCVIPAFGFAAAWLNYSGARTHNG